MSGAWAIALTTGTAATVVTGLHLLMLHALAGGTVVSTLFAAGPHLPLASLALAAAFLLVRLIAIVVLPAYLVVQVARVAVAWWRHRSAPFTGLPRRHS